MHVTDGIGLVVTRDGTVIHMRTGDTVYTPPGEEHWHGATADNLVRLPLPITSSALVRSSGQLGTGRSTIVARADSFAAVPFKHRRFGGSGRGGRRSACGKTKRTVRGG
ncbi:cupin domain-containing protein [Saccharopolyspora shandongensis]|uniref:cupin domain-containing protein n=1 Tax=Saccharopolyspora shandongensis TaxID=418495 RepID=UPI0033C634A4